MGSNRSRRDTPVLQFDDLRKVEKAFESIIKSKHIAPLFPPKTLGALLLSGWVDLVSSLRWLRLPSSHLTAHFDGQRRRLALNRKNDLLLTLPLQ
jgi:hypothetical protein